MAAVVPPSASAGSASAGEVTPVVAAGDAAYTSSGLQSSQRLSASGIATVPTGCNLSCSDPLTNSPSGPAPAVTSCSEDSRDELKRRRVRIPLSSVTII